MKNYVLILAAILLLSCKKNSQSKTSSSSGGSPSSNTTTLNDSATATAALVGVWQTDSFVNYSAGSPTMVILPTSTTTAINYSYTLTTTPYATGNPTLQGFYKSNTGGASTSIYWLVKKHSNSSTTYLELLSGFEMAGYIMQLDAHKLVVADNYGTVPQGMYRYYHK